MAKYDNGILQQFADRLYAKAAWAIWKCAIVGVLVGALIFGLPALVTSDSSIVNRYKGTGNGFDVPVRDRPTDNNSTIALVLVGAVLGVVIGYSIGERKAFQYRLLAQNTLCQMQIEYNTRRTE